MTRKSRATQNRVMVERRRPREEEESIFYIDPAIIPSGICYQWKTETVMGMQARETLASNLKNGWSPVPAERHPELVPPPLPGYPPDTLVRRGGMILCEMPKDYVMEDYANNERRTAEITAAKEAELGATTNSLYPRFASIKTDVQRFEG